MRKLAFIIPALLIGIIAGALIVAGLRVQNWFEGPDPESIASASLQSMREQARLVPFTARYVAVVTSRQRRFGLSAERTLIMPGTVRYEIDLARLSEQDLSWNPQARALSVTLPPIEIAGPEINFNEIREYGGGGVLSALTNAEERLDEANRNAGQQELLRQAKAPLPMKLAQDAARRAVERSFALPLRAAGVDATVEARFANETGQDPSQLDRSRRMEDVLKERQADR